MDTIFTGALMPINDILKYYEEVKDDLKFQNTSSVRIKIMINLMDGSKKTKDLRKSTGIQSSTILHGIIELEKQKLVSRKGDNYYLSELGQIVILKIVDMIKTSVSLKKFRKLWLNHEIESIPQHLLMKIGDLNNSELIESENEDMFKTHGIHAQIILNATKIRGVSPIFYPDYVETFNSVLDKDINVELILTEEVLKKTIESHDAENLKNIKRLISQKKLKLWKIQEDVKVAFTVTDKSITLGLFSKKGTYNSAQILVSDHEDSIKWCNNLFVYYLKKAQKINLNYF
jgi:predicted transcriptional regulator